MSYVSSKELLLDAQKNHYAVGAFNVENMEMMQAVLAAAEAEKSPVILQTTPSTLKYADTTVFAAMARAMAEKAGVPVAMHLDHGSSFELCRQAALDVAERCGWTVVNCAKDGRLRTIADIHEEIYQHVKRCLEV